MVGKEVLPKSGQVTVWLGTLEEKKDNNGVSVKPFVLDLPALRNTHVKPAKPDGKPDVEPKGWGLWW